MEVFKELTRLNGIHFKVEAYLMENENPELSKLLKESKALCLIMAIYCSEVMNNPEILAKLSAERGTNPILLEDLEKYSTPLYETFIRNRAVIHKMSEFMVVD
jgi:hypothetical protein